jgi:hypothetical protein
MEYRAKDALSSLHSQIVQKLIDQKDGARIRCFIIPDWFFSHNRGVLTISGPAKDSTPPETTSWMEYYFNEEKETFSISVNIEPYLNDALGLILETWRSYQIKSEKDYEFHLRDALRIISRRWRMEGEPLTKEEQKGLIGELCCVLDAYHVDGIGFEAIENWDPSGHELYDIDSENWVIESKATNSEPETVSISYPEQLDFRIKKTLILAVTSIKKDSEKGKTLPEIIEFLLDEKPLKESSHVSKLELILSSRGFNKIYHKKYNSKWRIQGTRYLHIDSNSNVMPCQILEDIPATVRNIKYRLNTSNFTEEELESLIGM